MNPLHRKLNSLTTWAWSAVFRSPLLYLPFSLFFIFSGMDFLVLTEFENAPTVNIFQEADVVIIEDEALRDQAEIVKQNYKIYVLLLALVLTLGNARRMFSFFRQNLDVTVLYMTLLSSYLYSVDPPKVISNVANLVLVTCACVLLVSYQTQKRRIFRNALLTIFFSSSVILLGSILLLYNIDVDAFAMLQEGKRYGGLAGNANSLGIVALIGIWSGIALVTQKSRIGYLLPIIFISLLGFGYLLILSGSATALVISLFAAVAIFWGRLQQKLSMQKSIAINLTVVLLALVGSTIFVALFTGESFFSAFTQSLGKDSSLTGRTELWGIAKTAIAERPIFGWSYDSHNSVQARNEYWIPMHQYHNGYLDTMVAGGIVLALVLSYHLFTFLRKSIGLLSADQNCFILMIPLLFLVLHNFTEYSVLRTNNILWTTFTLCYVAIAHYARAEQPIPNSTPSRKVNRSQRAHSRSRRRIRFG